MGVRWNPVGFHLLSFFVLAPSFMIQERLAINTDGLALLEFRARIHYDPYNALGNWNFNDSTPCMWFGVHCKESKVQMLELSALSLEGTLAPELGKLSDLRSLVLCKNHFYNAIPKEFGDLTKLELLDLRENNLSGRIPAEIGRMSSLRRLLLCDNKFEGHIPSEVGKLNLLSELQFDENLASMLTRLTGCVNRKFGLCNWQSSLNQLKKAESLLVPIKEALMHYLNALPFPLFKLQKDSLKECQGSSCSCVAGSSEQQMPAPFARRRMLEQSKNLPAAPSPSGSSNEQIISLPNTRSSGTFPAMPKANTNQSPPPATQTTTPESAVLPYPTSNAEPTAQQSSASTNLWKYLIAIPSVAASLVIVAMLFMCQKQASKSIGPWKTGLSGQLQKAFVTGVPKLNRSELETACEDFSNIIDTVDSYTVYKGTLSSGVEIAVASLNISSSKEWSKGSETAYRRMIDTLSRVNHKNFVNLIGYCEEDEPFSRMMVFEYAPNGTVFEHLHIKEMEHLDWVARMRIIMGVAYCLQYMHHDLNPPVTHTNLNSTMVFLTDDYAAKVADINLVPAIASKKTSGNGESEHSELPPIPDPDMNVYSFGMLLLELISGKLPYSEEHGPLEKWAAEYLSDRRRITYMIDPTLKSFKNNELDVICEVIQECIQVDPRQRPNMKEITHKLKAAINIPPEQATPKLSPMWWAELEILSTEAT